MKAIFLAALRGWAVTVSVCGARCVPVERLLGHRQGTGAGGSGDWKLQSILVAEEDPTISQDQLEMTVKTEIVKCDKLME